LIFVFFLFFFVFFGFFVVCFFFFVFSFVGCGFLSFFFFFFCFFFFFFFLFFVVGAGRQFECHSARSIFYKPSDRIAQSLSVIFQVFCTSVPCWWLTSCAWSPD